MSEGEQRLRFTGHIAGVGTAEGTRVVLGCWVDTPFGPFADVMVERADGTRILLAPDARIAEFVGATYTFDEVSEVRVDVARTGTRAGSRWRIDAGPLRWEFSVGGRRPLGFLLKAAPPPLAISLTFARLTDRIAALLMPGVRTLGTAGGGRTEWYAARDLHAVESSRASWDGVDLGSLRDVDPPPRFGFGSTPRRPGVTALTSTVRLPPTA